MRGLTIIVVGADAYRYDAALSIAAAHAALGSGRTRVYLHAEAVTLLRDPPALAREAEELGLRYSACQTGLAEAGLDARDYPHVEMTGLVALLASLAEDRLLTI